MGLAETHKESNRLDIPVLVDCGCDVIVWEDGSGVEIEYCSLHKSAQKLFDAGNLALIELDRIGSDIGFEPDRYRERIKALDSLSRAVRMSERDNNAR